MKINVLRTSRPVNIPVRQGSAIIPELRIADRCDRCGARAYVAALIKGAFKPLLFCAHHFRSHETAIRGAAEEIRDERWKLEKSVKDQKEDVATWLRK